MKRYLKHSMGFVLILTMLFALMAVPAYALDLNFESISYVMTNKDVDAAIEAATGDTVVIEFEEISPDMTVKVPASGAKKIAATGKTLTVATAGARLTMNQKALQNLAKQLGDTGYVVLTNKVFPMDLTWEQNKAVLKYRPLLTLRTTITYNDKHLTLGKGGCITAKLYATSFGEIEVADYTVAHLATNGKVTFVETTYEDGALVAELDKLEVYAVIEKSAGTVCSHTAETVAAVAATCEKTGLTEGSRCSKCGEVLTAQQEVPALGHDYEETVAKEPGCAEEGIAKFVCTRDASHTYEAKIEPTGNHKYSYADDLCIVCGAENPNPVENPFTDVAAADWYYAPVMWAYDNNVTGGVGEGLFGPNVGCTRGQVVTFLWAAAGRPEPTSLNNPFNDVAESDYFYKAVLWAVEKGITGGLGEGIFGPHATCTRGQIVTFLWASQGKPEVSGTSNFYDVADTDWYAKPVIWAAKNAVTGGLGDGGFGPNNTCTRGQVVTFLYKVYG